MPLYEYQCQNCGKKTEVIQRFDDAPLAACPACGGEVKKLISSPAFQFKGTGWYVTDYAGKGKAKPGEGGKSESGKTESGGESKAAEKPEKSSSSSDSASGGTSSETKAAKAAGSD